MDKENIVIFTGAGVSSESGLKTFRDFDGHWNEYKIDDVASLSGWLKNPQLVLDFYNLRKDEYQNVLPNNAHYAIAELEKYYNVTVITQNVDHLHERAGSTDVVHLHGTLDLRSVGDKYKLYPYDRDINVGDLAEDGYQLRPNVVWFNEILDENDTSYAEEKLAEADVLIIIGTSLQVAPACYMPNKVSKNCRIIYIDPNAVYTESTKDYYILQNTATEGMEIMNKILINEDEVI